MQTNQKVPLHAMMKGKTYYAETLRRPVTVDHELRWSKGRFVVDVT